MEKKYYLKEEGCCPLEITETEYNAFCKEIRKKRADKLIEDIKGLCDMIGIEATKNIIKTTLLKKSSS